jgi:hypothetical protein
MPDESALSETSALPRGIGSPPIDPRVARFWARRSDPAREKAARTGTGIDRVYVVDAARDQILTRMLAISAPQKRFRWRM